MKNKHIYLGIFFILIQIIIIIGNLLMDFFFFFWLCDFIPLLFGVAFLLNKPQMVKATINFGLIPQFIYVLNVIYITIFKIPLANNISWLLNENWPLIISIIFIHLATIVAVLFTYKIKPTKKTLVQSFILITVVFIITAIFTDPADNINYVFTLPGFWSVLWIPITFFIVILPGQAVQHSIYKFYKSRKHRR